ncbi:hypothetical protein M406DRAFT_99695 [Cryphonectria parasitica EP155]|uniref:Uncharacterized protein n=1 Tax=Cryphonectria parasitica (strain ATCC 38755 / EP155) TaxID=660469 RepID=A0A9P4XZA6_CRYP1|nr:uncharacterized protein M406DRAFT_99695 [Cryphonectria parasitica EP155]KAF3763527.1 hypothetical protein M406DRAFT_99695 [Cryphonectria parasitica EP155]
MTSPRDDIYGSASQAIRAMRGTTRDSPQFLSHPIMPQPAPLSLHHTQLPYPRGLEWSRTRSQRPPRHATGSMLMHQSRKRAGRGQGSNKWRFHRTKANFREALYSGKYCASCLRP